jgi:hypothetical protein
LNDTTRVKSFRFQKLIVRRIEYKKALSKPSSSRYDKWTSLSPIIWRHLSVSRQGINGSTNLNLFE